MEEIQRSDSTTRPKSHRVAIGALGGVMIGTVIFFAFLTKSTLILLNPFVAILFLIGVVTIIFSIASPILDKLFRDHFSIKRGLLAFLLIGLVTIPTTLLISYLIALPEKNDLQSQKKAERDSFTLLSPTNNSVISGPVNFVLPGSRKISVENITSTLQTQVVDHATIVIRGPLNKELRPFRQGDKMLFTAELPSGSYTAFARQEPWNNAPGYNAYQFDHPQTPTISFRVENPLFVLDSVPPQIHVVGTSPAPTMASATITASTTDHDAVSAEMYTNGLLWCPALPITNGTITCQLNLKYNDPLTEIEIKVYDSQGNIGTTSKTL